MTQQEFDEAVERLRRDGGRGDLTEVDARVLAASGFIMKQRLAIIPDDQPWSPSDTALAEFLAGADRRQRRLLKEIAEGLTLDAVGPAVPKTTH